METGGVQVEERAMRRVAGAAAFLVGGVSATVAHRYERDSLTMRVLMSCKFEQGGQQQLTRHE